tara:strand:+ start:10172 stop:12043 length:1872 start_codon:yes stop_codon:yes gene_type:complete
MGYRVKTAVMFDPSFDSGQSAFKAYWAGHLGRAEMNMAIWKARLKMASPETRRAVEKDLNDRIYKLTKLKTDMIKAKQEGNQELLMKTMELIQKDIDSRNDLAKTKITASAGIKKQQADRLIEFENAGPVGDARAVITSMPDRIAPNIGKVPPNISGNALLTHPATKSAFTQLDMVFNDAANQANTQTEVDRVAADMLGQIMKMNTGEGDRGRLMKNALIHRLARTVSLNTNVNYGSGSDMVNSLTMKYSDKALGLTQDQLAAVVGYGGGRFDPGSIIKSMGGPGALGGSTVSDIRTTAETIDNEIARLRGELELAKQETAASRKEFDWLMRGGMGNMALRPVGSKLTPSPVAEYVRGIGDLYQADPEYAKRFLDTGDVGRAGPPTPFQEQLDDPTKKYMSGVDYLQNSVNELKEMFGPTTPYAPETAKQMARQKLIEMANAIKPVEVGGSGILDPSNLTEKITMSHKGRSQEVSLKSALEKAESVLTDPNKTEEQKDAVTNSILQGLTFDYTRREIPLVPPEREQTMIGTDLGDRLKSAIDSKDAGDSGSYYGQVTQLYNDVVQRPESTWGGLERSLVESVQQNLINPQTRNSDVFDFKLRELVKPEMLEPDYGQGPLIEEQ